MQEIEKYLLDQGERQCRENSQIEYTAIIYDKFGEERIDSFQNYKRTTLPNDAKRISLVVKDYHNFVINISFSIDAVYSFVRVRVVDNSSKEKATGIVNAIEAHLSEHKNLNFIFHNWLVFLMQSILWVSIGWTLPDLIRKKIELGSLIGLIIIGVSLLYFCLKVVNPYSVLDTNKNRQMSSFVKWILNGLASVFLFGLLATYIRKYFLGF